MDSSPGVRPVISLLTDFGLDDVYVGVMKAVCHSIAPQARFIDITHSVPPQSVAVGAYRLRGAWRHFPAGSVHLAVVDPGVGTERLPIVVQASGHTFVGPDNGLLESAIEVSGAVVRHAQNSDYFLPNPSATFHGRDIFAPVAAWLARGVDPKTVGPLMLEPVRLEPSMPRAVGGGLEGEIIDVDVFGNLISNISGGDATGAKITLQGRPLPALSRCYGDVPKGQLVTVTGSTGRLEISVNGGSAAAELSVGVGARIRVEKGTQS